MPSYGFSPINPDPGPSIDDIISRWGLPTSSGAATPASSGGFPPNGLQPNGMIHLGEGRMWNPNDSVPADYAAGFTPPSLPPQSARSPMGSFGDTASSPAPQPAQAPTGMFGAKPKPQLQSAPLNLVDPNAAPTSLPVSQLNLPTPNVPAYHPHFFDKGGLGSKILSGVGEFALQYSASQGNPAALAVLQNRFKMQEEADQDRREQAKLNKPQVHFGDDGSVISFDPVSMKTTVLQQGRPKEDTKPAIQRTYEYLQSIGRPDLAESYLKNESNPLMGVPTTDAQGNQSLTFVPRSGVPSGGSGAPGSMPAPAGGMPMPGPATALSGNNPGGIMDGGFARRQPGYTGANGKFAGFRTPEDGANAQKALLRSYIQRGFDTPMKIASRWAPAGDGGNDPSAYAGGIARQLGIGVNDRVGLNDVDRFQPAQATQENGMYRPPASAATAPSQPGGSFPPSPYPTIMTKPAPNKLTSMGQDKGNPVPVRSPQEAASLPPGTYFRDPNGNIRQRH